MHFLGIMAGVTGIVFLFFIGYMSDSSPTNIQGHQASNSSASQVSINKPFVVSNGESNFEIVLKDLATKGYRDGKYFIKLPFTYKNLGPREGKIYIAQTSHNEFEYYNSKQAPGEVKTEKGHIYKIHDDNIWDIVGRGPGSYLDPNKEYPVKSTNVIGEIGKGIVSFAIPIGSVPVEITFGGNIRSAGVVLRVPEDIQARLKKDCLKNPIVVGLAGR